ncbi:MAG TPA: hypothetical protein PK096_03375 [Candidatus Saccharibacteria bacterium]|nr:hypothetical protein [Candidatus Saccharibacteria bacterium]HRK94384.1 hypothetical protein [Candidatus Saccharibacteria bacterium]
MTDERKKGAPEGAFLDVEDALETGRTLLEVTEMFRRRLAASAFGSIDRSGFETIAGGLSRESDAINEVVEAMEDKDTFGDEESYWNVFRFFCLDKSRGKQFTIEEVWRHVAKSYDMSEETTESLADTLREWADDLAEDTFSRFGAKGRLVEIAGTFSFAPLGGEPIVKPVEPSKSFLVPDVIESLETEVSKATKEVSDYVLQCVAPGPIKQAELRKQLAEQFPELDEDTVFAILNEMVETGQVFKFKPVPKSAAYFARDESDIDRIIDLYEKKLENTQEREQENETLDIALGAEILSGLAGLKQHLRRLEPVELWRTINKSSGMPEKSDTTAIKRAARLMSEMGLVYAGEMKKGTGGSRSGALSKRGMKSKSTRVFKIGLASYDVKAEIKRLMNEQKGDALNQWLSERWQTRDA